MNADQQSKFKVKFALKDAVKGDLTEAHQVFLKFTEVASGREVIYLAETGLAKTYEVEIVSYLTRFDPKELNTNRY